MSSDKQYKRHGMLHVARSVLIPINDARYYPTRDYHPTVVLSHILDDA